MKRILTLIVALIVCSAANAQVLFEISGNGLEKPSYIVGTCHVVADTFVDSIPGAKRVIESVEQVCGEIENSDLRNPDTLMAMQQLMMLPGDSTLKDLISEDQFNKMVESVKTNLNIDLNQPQYGSLLKLRPIYFSITVAALSEQMKAISSGKPMQQQEVMDIYFQKQAAEKGKKCIALETSSYQARLITSASDKAFSPKELIENFIGNIEKFDSSKAEVYKLVDVYKSLQFDKIEDYIIKSMEQSKDIETIILSDRNRNWSKQMPAIMNEKTTLFAVGFAHLAGPESILNLLKAQGYKIEAVKE